MFKFLKEKLKGAISKFSKDVEKEAEDIVEEKPEEIKEKPVKEKKEKPKKPKKAEKISEKIKEKEKKIEKIEKKKEKIEKEIKEIEKEKVEEKIPKEKIVKEISKEKLPEITPKAEEKPEEIEEKKEKKGFLKRLFGKKKEEAEEIEEKKPKEAPEVEELLEEVEGKPKPVKPEEEIKPEEKPAVEKEEVIIPEKEIPEEKGEVVPEEIEEKKGFLAKLKAGIVSKKLSESKFEDLFFDLEIILLENNVAVEVIEKLKQDLKKQLVDKKLNRFEIEKIVEETLKVSLSEILTFEPFDMVKKAKQKKPYVIVFVGVNGSGKTTTIAKIAKLFQNNNVKAVIAASDTFRAAAIDQLQEHANRVGVKMIKHDYGSDPAAVAFDAIRYAESKDVDVVLVDTAGRLHVNVNLMDELKKVIRVAKPDLKLFIGESITGNDCVEQATKFNEAIDIDGIILSKADIDEKGGAAISVSYVTKKPILYLGTGQNYEDLEMFDKEKILGVLGF